MTVKELRDKIKNLDDNNLVVIIIKSKTKSKICNVKNVSTGILSVIREEKGESHMGLNNLYTNCVNIITDDEIIK